MNPRIIRTAIIAINAILMLWLVSVFVFLLVRDILPSIYRTAVYLKLILHKIW